MAPSGKLIASPFAPANKAMTDRNLRLWKKLVRPFVPTFAYRLKRALFGWRWFRGRYTRWDQAQAHSTGYGEPGILAKVLHATLEVKAGRAVYERDSVLFYEPAADAELLANLRYVAAQCGGRLRVLDFGGALGTMYWQHRSFLIGLSELAWDVVEQPHFVAAGQKYVQDGVLRFFPTIAEAISQSRYDVLLISGVVNFLPDPHGTMEQLVGLGAPWMIFHNVPLHDNDSDYVMVEHVPPEIYPAIYPMWFFNRQIFMAHFNGRYTPIRLYASPAVWERGLNNYCSTGMLLQKR